MEMKFDFNSLKFRPKSKAFHSPSSDLPLSRENLTELFNFLFAGSSWELSSIWRGKNSTAKCQCIVITTIWLNSWLSAILVSERLAFCINTLTACFTRASYQQLELISGRSDWYGNFFLPFPVMKSIFCKARWNLNYAEWELYISDEKKFYSNSWNSILGIFFVTLNSSSDFETPSFQLQSNFDII